ncbi:MAG: HlyD family efflux transporter periplasmic adaptor subunit [Clostridiales bacterium]
MIKKIIISIIVIVIIGGFIALNIYNKNNENGAEVKAEKITTGIISSSTQTSGEIFPSTTKEVFFNYDVPLKVKTIFFKKYDSIKKGDRLVEFEIPKYTSSSNENKIKDMEKSPIDGVLTELNLKEDSFYDGVTPGFSITNLKNLYITAKVKDSYIKYIKKGQDVKITGEVFEEDEFYEGKVNSIAPIASKNLEESGEEITVDVMIKINKQSPKLKPGLKVDCEIKTEVKENAVIGKFEMIKYDKDNNEYVFIVDNKTNKVKEIKIELGIVSDMEFEILKGVSSGDTIVLNPAPSLKDGDLVEISKD